MTTTAAGDLDLIHELNDQTATVAEARRLLGLEDADDDVDDRTADGARVLLAPRAGRRFGDR